MRVHQRRIGVRGDERGHRLSLIHIYALRQSLLPSDGVGLARMEFVFASWVGVHPLALTRYASLTPAVQRQVDTITAGYADKTAYFVDRRCV